MQSILTSVELQFSDTERSIRNILQGKVPERGALNFNDGTDRLSKVGHI